MIDEMLSQPIDVSEEATGDWYKLPCDEHLRHLTCALVLVGAVRDNGNLYIDHKGEDEALILGQVNYVGDPYLLDQRACREVLGLPPLEQDDAG